MQADASPVGGVYDTPLSEPAPFTGLEGASPRAIAQASGFTAALLDDSPAPFSLARELGRFSRGLGLAALYGLSLARARSDLHRDAAAPEIMSLPLWRS